MRILGVDYGTARTGIAVSDLSGILACGVETIFGTNARKVIKSVLSFVEEYDIGIIVVGLPKNMNNTIGERANATLKFVELLKAAVASAEALSCKCDVITWDERLSTVSAIGILNETNTRGKKRKAVIDTVAAEIILQNYLDYKNKGGI